jgi:2-C-methyl-D-erythritol 4-phosphate cytidylyltransferase
MVPSPEPFAAAILLAAGRSTRMGAELPRKPFLALRGRSVLERACAAFEQALCVKEIVLVAHEQDVPRITALRNSGMLGEKLAAVVPGGEERTDSVYAGTRALASGPEVVLVHDVARPLVHTSRIEAVARAARASGAALLAFPVRDTIKRSRDGRHAHETLDRNELWAARTPQAFRLERLREMLERASREGFRPTDDAALHERYFGPVEIVVDEPFNWKLTSPEDLALAEAWLGAEEEHE